MKYRYKNPWYLVRKGSGPEYYENDSDSEPELYKGYQIFTRQEHGPIFDVVLEGICVTQRAGINGAKRAIDNKEWETA